MYRLPLPWASSVAYLFGPTDTSIFSDFAAILLMEYLICIGMARTLIIEKDRANGFLRYLSPFLGDDGETRGRCYWEIVVR